MKFTPSTPEDLTQIAEWINLDLDHQNRMPPEWWLTGNDCVCAASVKDDIGTVLYIRMDKEGDLFRLHAQFGPREQVDKKRLVAVLTEGFPKLIAIAIKEGAKGIVFESVSTTLIRFMASLGFAPDVHDDYVLRFKEGHT